MLRLDLRSPAALKGCGRRSGSFFLGVGREFAIATSGSCGYERSPVAPMSSRKSVFAAGSWTPLDMRLLEAGRRTSSPIPERKAVLKVTAFTERVEESLVRSPPEVLISSHVYELVYGKVL